ncbi:AAA lid domain protein [anaerobic digester metagenome]
MWAGGGGRVVEGRWARGGGARGRASRAWAFLDGRDYVLPEDVQAVVPGLAVHRLRPAGSTPVDMAAVLDAVPIP